MEKEKKDNITSETTKAETHKRSNAKIICIIAFAIIIITIGVILFLNSKTDKIVNTENDKHLLCSVVADNIKDIKPFSSGIVTLTGTSVDYIDASGARIASNTHLYAQPVILTNKSTVLLYNKGGDSFRIEKNGEIYNTYTVQGTISLAVLGKKNNYAYVMNDDGGFQSHLFVYSYKGNKQFEWGSASEFLVTAALSPNGKSIVLGLIGAENGEYKSHIILFDFKSDTPIFSFEIPNSTICELSFLGRHKISAVTDSGTFTVDEDGVKTEVLGYANKELNYTALSSGIKGISVARYGDLNNSYVSLFDRYFRPLGTREYKTEIKKLCADTSHIAVVLDNRIEILNKKNEIVAEIKLDEDIIFTTISSNKIYVLTLSGIYSFYLNGNVDETVNSAEEKTESQTIIQEETECTYEIAETTSKKNTLG